ncbi:MAG: hypothetical protein DRP76_01155, partial [Candidatus Omnitrophota bacterium]
HQKITILIHPFKGGWQKQLKELFQLAQDRSSSSIINIYPSKKHPQGKKSLNASSSLKEKIIKFTESLGYSYETGEELFAIVEGWEEVRKSVSYKTSCSEKEYLLDLLAIKIKEEFDSDSFTSSLEKVIRKKKANDLGYTQLFYILAKTIGLDVEIAEVGGVSPHISLLARLSAEREKVIDLYGKIIKSSEKFEHYQRWEKGDISIFNSLWEVIEKEEENKFSEARLILGKVLEKYPYFPFIYTRLGIFYQRINKHRKAIGAFQLALGYTSFSKPQASICNLIGLSYFFLKEFNQAIIYFQYAIELSPDISYYFNLAIVYYVIGRFDLARRHFEEIKRINPDSILKDEIDEYLKKIEKISSSPILQKALIAYLPEYKKFLSSLRKKLVSLGYEVKTCKISSLVEFSQNKEGFSLLLMISEGDENFIDLGERIFPSCFVVHPLYTFAFREKSKVWQMRRLEKINWKNLLSEDAYIILAVCRTGRKLVHFLSRNIDQKVVIIAPLEKIDDIKIKEGEPLGVTFLNKGREVESIEVGASSPLSKKGETISRISKWWSSLEGRINLLKEVIKNISGKDVNKLIRDKLNKEDVEDISNIFSNICKEAEKLEEELDEIEDEQNMLIVKRINELKKLTEKLLDIITIDIRKERVSQLKKRLARIEKLIKKFKKEERIYQEKIKIPSVLIGTGGDIEETARRLNLPLKEIAQIFKEMVEEGTFPLIELIEEAVPVAMHLEASILIEKGRDINEEMMDIRSKRYGYAFDYLKKLYLRRYRMINSYIESLFALQKKSPYIDIPLSLLKWIDFIIAFEEDFLSGRSIIEGKSICLSMYSIYWAAWITGITLYPYRMRKEEILEAKDKGIDLIVRIDEEKAVLNPEKERLKKRKFYYVLSTEEFPQYERLSLKDSKNILVCSSAIDNSSNWISLPFEYNKLRTTPLLRPFLKRAGWLSVIRGKVYTRIKFIKILFYLVCAFKIYRGRKLKGGAKDQRKVASSVPRWKEKCWRKSILAYLSVAGWGQGISSFVFQRGVAAGTFLPTLSSSSLENEKLSIRIRRIDLEDLNEYFLRIILYLENYRKEGSYRKPDEKEIKRWFKDMKDWIKRYSLWNNEVEKELKEIFKGIGASSSIKGLLILRKEGKGRMSSSDRIIEEAVKVLASSSIVLKGLNKTAVDNEPNSELINYLKRKEESIKDYIKRIYEQLSFVSKKDKELMEGLLNDEGRNFSQSEQTLSVSWDLSLIPILQEIYPNADYFTQKRIMGIISCIGRNGYIRKREKDWIRDKLTGRNRLEEIDEVVIALIREILKEKSYDEEIKIRDEGIADGSTLLDLILEIKEEFKDEFERFQITGTDNRVYLYMMKDKEGNIAVFDAFGKLLQIKVNRNNIFLSGEVIPVFSIDKFPQLGDMPQNLIKMFKKCNFQYGKEIHTPNILTFKHLNPLLIKYLNEFKNINVQQRNIFKELPEQEKAHIIRCFNVIIPSIHSDKYENTKEFAQAIHKLKNNLKEGGFLIFGTYFPFYWYFVFRLIEGNNLEKVLFKKKDVIKISPRYRSGLLIKGLKESLDISRGFSLKSSSSIKKGAVVILLTEKKAKLSVLFIRRSKFVRYPGKWAFPGGEFDVKKDRDLKDTAIRELTEETNIRVEEIIGQLNPVLSEDSQFIITPFIGIAPEKFEYKPSEEIEKRFWLPLEQLDKVSLDFGVGTEEIIGQLKNILKEQPAIFDEIYRYLKDEKDLSGFKAIVTAGPNREEIPGYPAYISNPSSGKQGFEIAKALSRRGAEVILITGPAVLKTPLGVERVNIVTAKDLEREVMKRVKDVDIYISAAAVADFCPQKIEKKNDLYILYLARNPDVLKGVGELKEKEKLNLCIVGFAAETMKEEDMVKEAGRKLIKKNLDLICGNIVTEEGAGFGVDTNKVVFISKGYSLSFSGTKFEVADKLLDIVIEILKEKGLYELKAPDKNIQIKNARNYLKRLIDKIGKKERVAFDVNFKGKRILITCGTTHEHIDPIRFIAQEVDIDLAFKLTEILTKLGARVILISGPTYLKSPECALYRKVKTTEEMLKEINEYINEVDVFINLAKSPQFRTLKEEKAKIKKKDKKDKKDLRWTLTKNTDIEEVKIPEGVRRIGWKDIEGREIFQILRDLLSSSPVNKEKLNIHRHKERFEKELVPPQEISEAGVLRCINREINIKFTQFFQRKTLAYLKNFYSKKSSFLINITQDTFSDFNSLFYFFLGLKLNIE